VRTGSEGSSRKFHGRAILLRRFRPARPGGARLCRRSSASTSPGSPRACPRPCRPSVDPPVGLRGHVEAELSPTTSTTSGSAGQGRGQQRARPSAREIMYTLGSTPQWAAAALLPERRQREARALRGRLEQPPGGTSSTWTSWRRLLPGTRGITAYQVWNEANLRDFYLGTPTQMATLTKEARAVLRRGRLPRPSSLPPARPCAPRARGQVRQGLRQAMRKAGWPVDAVSAHFYPPAKEGPATG
jgi:hypothetical protein